MTTLTDTRPIHRATPVATDPVHRHTRSCYWDVRRCGWQCPAGTRPAPPPPTDDPFPGC